MQGNKNIHKLVLHLLHLHMILHYDIGSLVSSMFPSTVVTITVTLPWLPPSLRIVKETRSDSSSTVSVVGWIRKSPAPASSSIIVSSAERPVEASRGVVAAVRKGGTCMEQCFLYNFSLILELV